MTVKQAADTRQLPKASASAASPSLQVDDIGAGSLDSPHNLFV
jgi:hypothetical protein